MVDSNPWETPVSSQAPRAARNPWEAVASDPVVSPGKRANPWESQPLNESNTLFGDATAETVVGEIGAGLQQGTRQVISSFPAVTALGTEGFQRITGVNMDPVTQRLIKGAIDMAEGGAKRGIPRVEDLEARDPVTWLRYAAGTIGEAVPFVASIMAGGGGLKLLTSKMAAKGVPASTRATIASRVPAELVGGVGTAIAIESGATAQELYGATGKVEPVGSLVAGTMKGSLEAIMPLMLGRTLGLTSGQATQLADRLLVRGSAAKAIAQGIGIEAATEALQEEIDIHTRGFYDENFDKLGPEAMSRRLNAAVAGGVGGGGLTAIARMMDQRDPVDTMQDVSRLRVRNAAGDVPLLTGAEANEMITVGPESIVRQAPDGLDVTVSMANTASRDQLLSEFDTRQRGLYAAAAPGQELTFGSQDQAFNDGVIMGAEGYVRLDPSKVRREDVSASVEDLPGELTDNRIEYLNDDTATQAQNELLEAVKLRNKAIAARSGLVTEQLLQQANVRYRNALNLGARVEPFTDSQLVLRNPAQFTDLIETADTLHSHFTEAGLAGKVTLPSGGEFHLFQKGAPEGKKDKRGRRLDLELVNPNSITGLPSPDHITRTLATQEVSRGLSLGRARGMGIRIDAPASRQRSILKRYINLLQSISASTEFSKQPVSAVERFKALTDQGLRLDVYALDQEFAVLEPLPRSQLRAPTEAQSGVGVMRDGGEKRIRKGRARTTAPRVGKYTEFHDKQTHTLFSSHFSGSPILQMLTGVRKGKDVGRGTQPSPLADMLRAVVKEINVPTDYVIVVVPPTVQKEGVKYEERDIVLTPGKKAQRRSVISINPWAYSQDTLGRKPLTEEPANYAMRGGEIVKRLPIPAADSPPGKPVQVQLPDGTLTTVAELAATQNELPSAKEKNPKRLTVAFEGGPHDIPTVVRFETNEGFRQRNADALKAGDLIPVNNISSNEVQAWRDATPGDGTKAPTFTPKRSRAAAAADALGLPEVKQQTDAEQVAEFFGDFATAVSQSIVTNEWGRTDAAVQEMLLNAWRQEMHLQKGTKRQTRLSRTVPHPLLDRALKQTRGKKAESYEFEEWLVANMARYFTRPRRLNSAVEKFLSSTGRKVKEVIDRLFDRIRKGFNPEALDPLQGEPHAIVDKWISQLQLRGVTNMEPPFLDEASRHSLLESIRKDQAALKKIGIDEYVVASPQRASTYQVRELLKLLPKEHVGARHKLEGLLASVDRHNTMMEWLLGIHQMAEVNPHITGLRDYVSLTRAMENEGLSWATMADKRVRAAQKLGKSQLNSLWGLMFELDSMSYIDPAKLKDGTEKARWPTPDELLALVQKHGLKKDAFDVYTDIRNDFLQFLSKMEQVSVQHAKETITDAEQLNARVQEIRGETAILRSRPYFPHMRFGRYAATVRDGKGKVMHFSAYGTRAERDAAIKDLAVRYNAPQSATVQADQISDHLQQYQGLPRYALKNIMRTLGLDGEDLSPQQAKDRRMLEALAEETTQTQAFRRQLMNRKNIAGYSLDGMRAYANYFGRSAKFLARTEFQAKIEQSITDVRNSGSPIARDKRTRIADFMARHSDAQMNPAADWSNVRGLGFMWYFAFAPAAAFVNLTQVPMVAMPFLAGKFGDLKTMGNVTKAYAENTRDYYKWLAGQEEHVQGPKAEAIEEAHFSRLIDDGFGTELAAISQGAVLQASIPGDSFTRGLRRFAQWGTSLFSMAERINRAVTFRAAYDMALNAEGNASATAWIDSVMMANKAEVDQLRIDRGWGERHLRAYMAAAEAVRKTQFEYNKWSRPKLMDGPRGVVFMFKTYLQNMLYFMFKTDRKVQVRFMLGMFGIAGLMGLPGAEDGTELMKFLARQMGYGDFDFQREARKLMMEWGVDDAIAPDVILHGASRVGFGIPAAMQGLGLPAPEIDMSGALSLGRLVPGLKDGLNPGSSFAQDASGRVVEEWAGPVLGVPFEMYKAITDMSLPSDDPKRWERMMPRSLRALSRGSRYLAEERERDRTGATVVDFDPNDWSDYMTMLAVGAGFQPTEGSRQWDMLMAQREVQNYWKGQRTVLMSEFWRAVRLKDNAAREDAMSAIKKFNSEAPDKALVITGKSLRQSLQNRSKAIEYKRHGVAKEKSLRGVTQEVRELFPEAIEVQKVPHK